MRAVAQMVSYEIPAVIALLGMVLFTGTMNLNRYSDLQAGIPLFGSTIAGVPDLGLGWFVFTPIGLVGFVIFYTCVLSEGERTPFDIPEADSEIVAGYMTEYSGMKFAIFYMGQFLFNYALSMVTAIVFLGGWNGPGVGLLAQAGLPFLAGALSVVYLLIKAWFLFFVMVWLRGAFPRLRLRVDQLMAFAWKFLLPLALVNIASAAIWEAIRLWGSDPKWMFTIGGVDPLGWVGSAPWARQLAGLVVTGIINGAAYYWLLQINRRPADTTPVELAEDQAFGAASLT
jgi:NADH-quinone oxidoreductase subunit H